MNQVYEKYKNGEITRKQAYNLLAGKMGIDSEKLESVYDRYFKPSEESCEENITSACQTFTNYMEYEDEMFLKFVYGMVTSEEKTREIKELSTTI